MAYHQELAHASTYMDLSEEECERLGQHLAPTADVRSGTDPDNGTGVCVRAMLPYLAGENPAIVDPLVQIFEFDLDCMAGLTFTLSPEDARKLAHALVREADLADKRQVQPSVQDVLEGIA